MNTYYITYSVYDDIFRYCVYITADSKEEAIEQFKKIEKDYKAIERCEIAY